MHNSDGDSLSDTDNIGGWPKIIHDEPNRPHDIFDEKSDETDEPNDTNYDMYHIYMNTENMYAAMEVFVRFHSLGLYPPKWALDHVTSKFKKHLGDPDPDLLASQLGISGRGSGSTNPYDEYKWWIERFDAISEMAILVSGFDITLTDAANAIITKRSMPITPKRLVNEFRGVFGDTKRMKYKNRRNFSPFFDEESRDKFLSDFPRKALKFIKDKKPRLKSGRLEIDTPAKT